MIIDQSSSPINGAKVEKHIYINKKADSIKEPAFLYHH